jgi:hypothetical protein
MDEMEKKRNRFKNRGKAHPNSLFDQNMNPKINEQIPGHILTCVLLYIFRLLLCLWFDVYACHSCTMQIIQVYSHDSAAMSLFGEQYIRICTWMTHAYPFERMAKVTFVKILAAEQNHSVCEWHSS